jgi:TrmH family RNA methyltransferase
MLNKQKIKDIQSLGQKKFREAAKVFIAEGPKLVAELLADENTAIKQVFATTDWLHDHHLNPDGSRIFMITDVELSRISQLSTPNKVIAVADQYEDASIELNNQVSIVLDGIQDPGNLGTIIRIADWFGVKQIIASEDTAEQYNPKVVQSSMGSIARVRVHYRDLREWLSSIRGIPIYAATLDGKDIRNHEKPPEGIIMIGNESKGIRDDLALFATERIAIKGKGKAESLNDAVATGIILSHLV